ncbi:MAG TPA: hypothetical protein VK988_14500 [Acidimicrobiales bacterium]|nr:hypothetical protein [Acidimicrobiales bacterium]
MTEVATDFGGIRRRMKRCEYPPIHPSEQWGSCRRVATTRRQRKDRTFDLCDDHAEFLDRLWANVEQHRVDGAASLEVAQNSGAASPPRHQALVATADMTTCSPIRSMWVQHAEATGTLHSEHCLSRKLSTGIR